ncbi:MULTISPECIES: hypothetical protein [Streptococcus]|uniref:Uncharacterized protein n=1 Tax=Streptococcus suis TaxID=1307 RepID=A0A0Z8EK21_STRSU|nr:hypothetical protein [Streptococcus suis]AWL25564.1 hypothetical protein DF184_03030 [Streptococcus suis]NQG44404.1 hypothetical protein [Streptococcus suis]NQH21846.1 hypothetical protein [Streptococcus suis]NQH30929.1 hypothetical protein [Streptococcus suis]NQH85520.1 hypothetical protein [Streptococcus suis]
MNKERVINLLDQLSSILAGKEEEIGKEKTGKLQSVLLVAKEDVASKEGVALANSLSGFVQTISNASLPGANLRFTDQERPVWEEFKALTEKAREDGQRGLHLTI